MRKGGLRGGVMMKGGLRGVMMKGGLEGNEEGRVEGGSGLD